MYAHYDRYIICNAALLLAAKILNYKKKISEFCMNYHKLLHYGQLVPPFNDSEMNLIQDKICIAECQVLKQVKFIMDINNKKLTEECSAAILNELPEKK